MKSQNGWTASPDRADIGVRPFTVAGIEFPGGVRGGGVALVLTYLVSAFHTRVEPLVAGWCWGYAYRAISGSNTVSNHGSGTAVDINAPRHPLGVKNTFTPAKVKAIRAILRELEGVVRWGGDYTGRVDEMHFEINADEKTVAAVARTLTLDSGEEDGMTPNDLLMAGLWYTYPTAAQAKAAGLPVVNGKQELTEKHPLGEWIAVHCIRQGMILAEAQKHTALLTEIRDALTAPSGTGKKSS